LKKGTMGEKREKIDGPKRQNLNLQAERKGGTKLGGLETLMSQHVEKGAVKMKKRGAAGQIASERHPKENLFNAI